MEEDSGRLYCTEKLDREEMNVYQVMVSCVRIEPEPTSTSDRAKRKCRLDNTVKYQVICVKNRINKNN